MMAAVGARAEPVARQPALKILYVGALREGGNGPDRIGVLRSHGFEVEGFDTRPALIAGPRLQRTLTARWQLGPSVAALNRDLMGRAERGGFDVVFVDKGTVLRVVTLLRLKQAARAGIAIHYTPDAAFVDNRSGAFNRAVCHYDLLVTTKPFEVDTYRARGAAEVMLIQQGFGPRIAPVEPVEIPPAFRSDVLFVGHCQPHYLRTLRAVARHLPLTIRGPGWPRVAAKTDWARDVVRGGGLYGRDYAFALGGAKIALGLLSKRVPETTTTRSFEIPAIGTMLLAERTSDHLALFEEGVEAEFFDGTDELLFKLRRYLADDRARTRIAAAGRTRCLSSGYETGQQFGRIAQWIFEACGAAAGSKTPLSGSGGRRHGSG